MPRSRSDSDSSAGSSDVPPRRTPARTPAPARSASPVSSVGSDEDAGPAPAPPPYPPYGSQSDGDQVVPLTEHDILSTGPFEAKDGDVVVSLNGEILATHKYLVRQFARLAEILESNSGENIGSRPYLSLDSLTNGQDKIKVTGEDFQRAFSIFYASPLRGPFGFSTPTFESALRLATLYGHPELREYAITHLERSDIDPIKAIMLSRQCDVPEWEEPARLQLIEREEMPSVEDCIEIGMEAFRDIAMRREALKRRKSNISKQRDMSGRPGPTPLQSPDPMASYDSQGADAEEYSRAQSTQEFRRDSTSTDGTLPRNDRPGGNKPCFLYSTPRRETLDPALADRFDMVEFLVRDCRCKIHIQHPDSIEKRQLKCRLPSCAYQAFKNLQKAQLLYAEKIERLEFRLNSMPTSDPAFEHRPLH